MTQTQQKAAARQFVKTWTGRGDEKQETQLFWISLLQNVFGVEQPTDVIEFEVPVKLSHTSFIDGYIKDTHVLIEQKGADIDLKKGYRQSDGSVMTPFSQARRYAGYLPHDRNPRWIVVCNFREFHIHDMNRPNDTPEVILLSDLEKEFHRLQFLVDTGSERIQKEMRISLQAGELVGRLYDSLLKQYKDPSNPASLRSLNMLCVRLVFCLYAEDADIFGRRNMFHDYLSDIPVSGIRKALVELFRILDTRPESRDPYLVDDNPTLAAFPYVNGGLFADEAIEIPPFTEELKTLLLSNASEDFDWSEISPTIFGAVFESTLNPETRRSGGMHYTSIENIHKVIDPLFYDGLKAELAEITAISVKKTREAKLDAYRKKLASLTFLDPACGSGNFLTETYLSLRRLENQAVAARLGDQIILGDSADFNPIQVSIGQFYGIEINDFAVTVAKTALWIAESQMMKETEEIVHMHMDFLPLTSYANIVEGNALRIDWESVVPKDKLDYIMGNPPFIGYGLQSREQKNDIQSIYVDENGKTYKTAGKIDYVAGWYFKASRLMSTGGGHLRAIRAAFVSTNSITQGDQVAAVWKPLYDRFSIHIDFAHQTFHWDSEASAKAHVHCVIVGFSVAHRTEPFLLYSSGNAHEVRRINAYLLEAPLVFVESRTRPLCAVPLMTNGNRPADGGNLIVTAEQYTEFVNKEPDALKYIKPFLGADEFLNGKQRYCLWLVGISPRELSLLPMVLDRVKKVREFRLASKKEATRKWADSPTLFTENRQPNGQFIVVPEVSSGNRKYVPMSFLDSSTICSNKLQVIEGAEIYHFGILMSNVHMAWMKKICGRLKSDYDYSAKIVYNNFPWPSPSAEQKARIEVTAQAILDARALYSDCSLADLYDEVTMPPELRRAHQQNDKAVMQAYGFWGKLNTETECVAELMKMYQALTR